MQRGGVWIAERPHNRVNAHRVAPSGQFGAPYKIYFLVESMSLQEITMDFGDCVAFFVIFLMGSFIIVSQFLEMPYESVVLTVIGSLMLTFCAWAFLSDTLNKYKIVRV